MEEIYGVNLNESEEIKREVEGFPVPLENIDLVWDIENDKFRIVYFNADGTRFKDMAHLDEIYEADDKNFIIPEYQIGGLDPSRMLNWFELYGFHMPFNDKDKRSLSVNKEGGYEYLTPTRAFLTHFILKQFKINERNNYLRARAPGSPEYNELANEYYHSVLKSINEKGAYLHGSEKNHKMATECGFKHGAQLTAKFLQVINDHICPNYMPISPEIYVHPDIETMFTKEVEEPLFFQQEVDSPVKIRKQQTVEQVLDF